MNTEINKEQEQSYKIEKIIFYKTKCIQEFLFNLMQNKEIIFDNYYIQDIMLLKDDIIHDEELGNAELYQSKLILTLSNNKNSVFKVYYFDDIINFNTYIDRCLIIKKIIEKYYE
jgi:hypothetical protein